MVNRKVAVLILWGLSLMTLGLLLQASGTMVAVASGPEEMRCGHGPGPNPGGLTAVEIEGLTYMREEEKLARDTYLTLYAKWHLSIFYNISNSEVMHMTKVKDLLDRYGLPDPAAGNPVGVFTNPTLQQMYYDLVARGHQSSTEALRVGVTIEEVDIADLEYYRARTNKTDILQVYGSLLNGSQHHLDAFNTQLGQ